MTKGQGVVYINYVDDKISSGMMGHAVNIFFDVYQSEIINYVGWLSIHQVYGEGDDLYQKGTHIPLSNIGLIEQFHTKEDFYKAYPHIKESKEGRDDR